MIDKKLVADLVGTFLNETSSESYLVEVAVSRDNSIVVKIDNDQAVDIDECAALSDYLNARIDRDAEDYDLEVSSAGLTGYFKVLRQFAKYAGRPVVVMTRTSKKLHGTLGKADETGFDITVTRMERPEGSRKKVEVTETLHFTHDEVNAVYYDLDAEGF